MNLRKLLFGGEGGGSAVADIGLLILRLGAGLTLALAHGMGKIPPQPRFVKGVAEMGFPFPEAFAWAASFSEFLGGLLVAVGLLTRPAALFAAVTMGVAFFIRHSADPFERKEMALLFMVMMVCLLFTGSGRFGLDRLVMGGKGK